MRRGVVLALAVLAAAVIVFFFIRAGRPPVRTLRVSQLRVLDMAPLYAALEKGFFEKEGIRIKLNDVGSPREGLDQLVAGKSDLAFSGDVTLALRLAQGAPVRILGTINGSSHTVGLLMKKQASPKDILQGKKVGLRLWTSPHFFLDTYLLYNLIQHEKVTLVDMEETRLEEALLNDEVDAVAGFQGGLSRIRTKHPELHIIYPEEMYRAFWVIAAPESLVAADPQTLERFLRALDRGVTFLKEHEAEGIAIVARFTGLPEEKVREHFPFHHFDLSLDNSLLVALEEEGEWAIESGGMKPPLPDYRRAMYVEAIKAVRPAGITLID